MSSAGNCSDNAPPVLDPGAPLEIARAFLARYYMEGAIRGLHHQGAAFYEFTGTHYREAAAEDVRSRLYAFLDRALVSRDGELKPFKPNKARVANALEALAAAAQIPTTTTAPSWLDARQEPNPADLLPCRNGLLHLPTRKLLPHTASLFALNALAFDFDPKAAPPAEWLRLLASIWPEDRQSCETLQEVFGLLLTGDTRHQKMVLIVGPKRSGKGTIARVLTHLIGQENVAAPTLNSLSQNFGMSPLIGKRAAIISDARLGGRSDQQTIAERLLSVTGEDTVTIDRKFREPWTGRLQVRFLILTNELPEIKDASGALASRFIPLVMRQSFYGREDHGLLDRLLPELPGILLWALEGLDRLRRRGHFIVPAAARSMQEELEDLGSPIGAFLRQRCQVAPGKQVRCDDMYAAWSAWCSEQNRDRAGTVQAFGRDLRAAVPGLATRQVRTSIGVLRVFEGVGLAA